MKRQIIQIDDEKCTGCGECIPGCPEGALQIIDGKARLVSDLFCDGLGACIGDCPEDAIKVVEKEAQEYNENLVMENIVKKGRNTIKAHLQHLDSHNQEKFLKQALEFLSKNNYEIPDYKKVPVCACSGSKETEIKREKVASVKESNVTSKLKQWPTQLSLFNPNSNLLDGADLLISADGAPFAYGNFHNDFLDGKILLHFCPKLDKNLQEYIEKLAIIFKTKDLKSVTIVRMEVPCCQGMQVIVQKALEKAGVSKIIGIKVISVDGRVL